MNSEKEFSAKKTYIKLRISLEILLYKVFNNSFLRYYLYYEL